MDYNGTKAPQHNNIDTAPGNRAVHLIRPEDPAVADMPLTIEGSDYNVMQSQNPQNTRTPVANNAGAVLEREAVQAENEMRSSFPPPMTLSIPDLPESRSNIVMRPEASIPSGLMNSPQGMTPQGMLPQNPGTPPAPAPQAPAPQVPEPPKAPISTGQAAPSPAAAGTAPPAAPLPPSAPPRAPRPGGPEGMRGFNNIGNSIPQINPQKSYAAVSGTVTDIANFSPNGCTKIVQIAAADGNVYKLIIEPATYFIDQIRLSAGMPIIAYYNQNTAVPLIYPPQYGAEVVALQTQWETVKVDYFDRNLVSSDNSLKLNIADSTEIVLPNGQAYDGNLTNRNLIVIYGTSTRSIPAQTTPRKIIVMCE